LFAVRGAANFYTLHSSGHNIVNDTTGANTRTEDGDGWMQSYLVQKSSTDAVKKAIDALLLDPPKPKGLGVSA
jgi:hypothetical protein